MNQNNIRSAVRAIIIEDRKILMCKYVDSRGEFYACVGGGQNKFEYMHSALKRECLEEVNARISIGELVFVREAFFDYDSGGEKFEKIHQIECFFKCKLEDVSEVAIGYEPDKSSIGIEWLDIDDFDKLRVYPSAFKDYICSDGSIKDTVYIGLEK